MKKVFLSFFMCVILLTSCANQTETEQTPKLLKEMSLEEKVGQMLFVRYPEQVELQNLLAIKPGGVIMFGRDFKGLRRDEVKNKINALQTKVPPVIGVDEEGGTVVRVSSNPELAPEKYASPQEIYKSGGMAALIENTAEKSRLLTGLGITMNLAPVADVSQDENDFMYSRSMGADAEETAECIRNIVFVMKEKGILSCLKHFPGYGSSADTHDDAVTDFRDADSFRQITVRDGVKTGGDFIPFKAGIDAGADSVLVSHNVVTALDSDNPASLSPEIHRILREELGFDGVIITDDIAMGAVAEIDGVYIKAVNAGNDLIITTDYMTAYNEILNAVKQGIIDKERINQSVGRILRMKGLIK